MNIFLLSSFLIICVSSGLCLAPIPTGQGLIPTDDNYISSPRAYGLLSENQLVVVTFINPDNGRPFSGRLSMKYNVTRKDDSTNRNTVVEVKSIDAESYLELNKDELSYMNGEAWNCNLANDKMIFNYSDISSLCEYIKSRAKVYPVGQKIEYQLNPETGVVKDNMDNIKHQVVDFDEVDEMIDKYFKPSIHNIGNEYIKGKMNMTRNGMPLVRTLYLTNDRMYHLYEIYNTNNELLMKGYARYYITRSEDDRYTYVKIDSVSHKYSIFEFPNGGSDAILVTGGCNTVEKDKKYTVDELSGPCATMKTLVLGEDGFKYNTMFSSLDSTAKIDIFEGLDMFQANGVHIDGQASGSAGAQAFVNEIMNFDANFDLKDDSGVSVLPLFLLVIMAIIIM